MLKVQADKYLGQTRMMTCGMNATVIAYRGAYDIDVQFEDGTIRKHMRTGSFNRGNISHTPDKAKYCIGQTKIMNCGLKATVIAYRNANDIDVEFEDNTIQRHKTIYKFRKGQIVPTKNKPKNKYIGQTQLMSCGMKATIIDYRTFNDIDIQFENGIIREHMNIQCFKRGGIAPVQYGIKNNYIGQTRLMNCGVKATIITYRGSNDIDVQFENGTIRKHMRTCSFKKGEIAPANYQEMYIGQTHTMNCGMKATVIAYRQSYDIDIQFEDGVIREHMKIDSFNKGNIAHPTNVLFNTYKLNKVAFVFHNKTYFYVTYTKDNCEAMDVMCIDDMKQKLPVLAK